MSKIEFVQAEVVAAAGRAWHKREPAIIQQDGFPIASIVFTNASKNSFAGYGEVLDFQITDPGGRAYVAQIGKDMVVAAAEVQFPDDFTTEKVVEDFHDLIPAQIVQRRLPNPSPTLQMLLGAGDVVDHALEAIFGRAGGVQEVAEEESYSKRIRREVKALINDELPDHGAFKTGERGLTTVVWKKTPGSSFVYVATATASLKDQYKVQTGVRIAYKRLNDGECIAVPLVGGTALTFRRVRSPT